MAYLSQAIGFFSRSILPGSLLYILIYFTKLRQKKESFGYLFFNYIFCIYIFAVFLVTRIISDYGFHFNIGVIEYIPFQNGFHFENILNSILFIPFGILIPILTHEKKHPVQYILFGSVLSVMIELLQFFFVGRLADIDDIIMNTIGAIIGLSIYYSAKNMFDYISTNLSWKIMPTTINILNILLAFPFVDGRLCLADLFIANVLNIQYAWLCQNTAVMDFKGIHLSLIYLFIITTVMLFLSLTRNKNLCRTLGIITSLFLCIMLIILFIIGII